MCSTNNAVKKKKKLHKLKENLVFSVFLFWFSLVLFVFLSEIFVFFSQQLSAFAGVFGTWCWPSPWSCRRSSFTLQQEATGFLLEEWLTSTLKSPRSMFQLTGRFQKSDCKQSPVMEVLMTSSSIWI